jgi:hypothetical protein
MALLRCIRHAFLAPVIPRLLVIIFRYSQPALIRYSIQFVTSPAIAASEIRGYWLVLSAVVVYLGLGVSAALLTSHSSSANWF